MFNRKEKEIELKEHHSDYLEKINGSYIFTVKTGFFHKGKIGRNVQFFETELSKGMDIYVELVDNVKDSQGKDIDLVPMFEERVLFKYNYNPYFSEEYEVKIGTNSRGDDYSAYIVPTSELVTMTESGEEIPYNVYDKRRIEAPKQQTKLSVFPDFEEQFGAKKEEEVLMFGEESASDILLRIAADFQKLAQKLK